MKSRIRIPKRSNREQTPDFSTAPVPAQAMFQSRPFVVPTKSEETLQQPDLKTKLIQAERYGHHVGRRQLKVYTEAQSGQLDHVVQPSGGAVQLPQHALTETPTETPSDKTVTQKKKNVIQRQPITEEAAEAAMKERGGEFAKGTYKILTPWGNEPQDTNCHGYTIDQKVGRILHPRELLNNIKENDNVAIFISDKEIQHSGRYSGNELKHFLLGIGVVESTLDSTETAGYQTRCNLPQDRGKLAQLLGETRSEEAAEERRDLVGRILDHANSDEVSVQKGVTIDDWNALKEAAVAQDKFIEKNLEEINRVRGVVNSEHGGNYEEIN